MKKYILVFILAVCAVFSACSESGAVSGSITESESAISESKEETVVLTNEQQIVMQALELKSAPDFFGNSVYEDFSNAGYSIEVKSQRLGDDDFTVLYDLEFVNKKSGKVFLFENLSAKLNYTMTDLNASLHNLYIEGAAAGVCGSEIYIADLDRLRFFDIETFERISNSVFFENDSNHNVMFYNVIKDSDTYIIACRSGGEHVILMTNGQGGVYKFKLNLKDEDSYVPFRRPMSIREGYSAHIFFGDYYCYDINSYALYNTINRIKGENDGETFYFEKWESLSTTGGDFYQLTAYKDGVATVDVFESLDINEVFGTNQETNEFGTNVTMTFSDDNRNVVIHCPDTQTTVTLDRETDIGTVQYSPDAGQIRTFNPIYSNDHRYTIYHGASMGGGDYSASQRILHDSLTAEYRYIDTVSIYEEIGFFSNNDIWVLRDDDFIIYEEGMAQTEPKFVLSDNFPLGWDIGLDGVWGRFVFAVRRDPEKQDYVVLYAEFPDKKSYYDFTGYVPDCWRPTYKLALLDSNGVVQKSIDTGVNVKMALYDFMYVNMYLEQENIIHFAASRNETILAEATVNIVTDEVTIIANE